MGLSIFAIVINILTAACFVHMGHYGFASWNALLAIWVIVWNKPE